MGRKRKFTTGDVVWWGRKHSSAVVVDYRQDYKGRGEYRVVRLLAASGGKAYGPAIWVQSHFLSNNTSPRNRRDSARTIWRANQRIGDKDRGCTCNCCPHIAMTRSEINHDGTFTSDEVG